MKKLLLSSLITTSIVAFAYTQVNVDNANYLANKNIITQQSTAAGYRLNDNITRAEVAGIALKLRGTTLPEGYVCKKYFSDTLKNDWICRATELAADAGLVSRANATFRPQDKITRAEALSIIMRSVGLFANGQASFSTFPYSDVVPSSWQAYVVLYAAGIGIINHPNIIPGSVSEGFKISDKIVPIKFYPNNMATRAEVFEFAKNTLQYQAMMSGEVSI